MEELLDLLAAMRTAFDELLAVENKKLDAIGANNMDVLDECIKQEEAISLNLRGIDKKREELQRRLGYPDCTLAETAEKIGGMDGAALAALQAELSEKARTASEAIEASRKVVQTNMDSINEALAVRAAEEGGYQPNGDKDQQPDKPRFTPKEV